MKTEDLQRLPSLKPLPYGSVPSKKAPRWGLFNTPLWVLTEDWVCCDVTVQKGFVTDLDSIPRLPFFYSIFKGRSRNAALVHDWLYATSPNREEADKHFLRCMLEENVPKVVAYTMYCGVRTFGWIFHNKNPLLVLDLE